MANKNYMGLLGTANLRDISGDPISDTKEAFWHGVKWSISPLKNVVTVDLLAWESKADYRNDDSGGFSKHITNLFSRNNMIRYVFDDSFTIRKGRDRLDGDGVQTDFIFTKNMTNESLVLVEVDGVIKSLSNDYTVIFDSGDSGTGTVRFIVPPSGGSNNVHITKLNRAYTDYFKPSKLKNVDNWYVLATQEILGDMDGTDPQDSNNINFKSATKDTVE